MLVYVHDFIEVLAQLELDHVLTVLAVSVAVLTEVLGCGGDFDAPVRWGILNDDLGLQDWVALVLLIVGDDTGEGNVLFLVLVLLAMAHKNSSGLALVEGD